MSSCRVRIMLPGADYPVFSNPPKHCKFLAFTYITFAPGYLFKIWLQLISLLCCSNFQSVRK
ncbi:predicted protein [Sclerotinia sclerotiorum 1980 UF-70]|uniref:Uncharacterized protein n=1 Tax=Sclerotinia sclerotiorum (strain ATCC 18683 / 1980 / Ss-1) TaxID=665079 RepID=A7E9B9_SCLS1|nr:predicted protein [Sclerotinia sclerotiorum 1980 UF-70]EDN96971.1 predicted protein [Sclerotinia sclerotiorum 1980 UF-70]